MTRHRAEPPRRRALPPPGHRRAEKVRPRYGRLAVLGAAVSVTGIAMLGGIGVLPSVASGNGQDGSGRAAGTAADSVLAGASTSLAPTPTATAGSGAKHETATGQGGSKDQAVTSAGSSPSAGSGSSAGPQDDVADNDTSGLDPPVPADSGQ